MLVMVSLALVTTLPLGSRTTPVTDAVESWANAGWEQNNPRTTADVAIARRKCDMGEADDKRCISNPLIFPNSSQCSCKSGSIICTAFAHVKPSHSPMKFLVFTLTIRVGLRSERGARM